DKEGRCPRIQTTSTKENQTMTIRTDMKMKYLSAISGFGKALCLSLLLLAAASVPAFAQADVYGAWTSVGSTGTVDEADAANVGFNATQVYLTAGATSATILQRDRDQQSLLRAEQDARGARLQAQRGLADHHQPPQAGPEQRGRRGDRRDGQRRANGVDSQPFLPGAEYAIARQSVRLPPQFLLHRSAAHSDRPDRRPPSLDAPGLR